MFDLFPKIADLPYSEIEKRYGIPNLLRLSLLVCGILWGLFLLFATRSIMGVLPPQHDIVATFYLMANYMTLLLVQCTIPGETTRKLELSGDAMRIHFWYFGLSYPFNAIAIYVSTEGDLLFTGVLILLHTALVFVVLHNLHKIQTLAQDQEIQMQRLRNQLNME